MTPSLEQIERWARDDGDGYTAIPTSAFTELRWLLGMAERAEEVVTAAQAVVKAHGPTFATARGSVLDRLVESVVAYNRLAAAEPEATEETT